MSALLGEVQVDNSTCTPSTPLIDFIVRFKLFTQPLNVMPVTFKNSVFIMILLKFSVYAHAANALELDHLTLYPHGNAHPCLS